MHTTLAREIQSLLSRMFKARIESVETDLIESGLIDSLRLIDLLMQLEQQYGIEFDYQSLEHDDLRSAAALASLVERRRAQTTVAA